MLIKYTGNVWLHIGFSDVFSDYKTFFFYGVSSGNGVFIVKLILSY